MTIRIGILGIQGAFIEHEVALRRANPDVITTIVRGPEQFEGLDGLIIPGGESTTISMVAERYGVMEVLCNWVRDGRPVFGTCAGLIMLADEVISTRPDGGQSRIGGLACRVHRNYYGSQTESFLAPLQISPTITKEEFQGVFIRAPYIEAILSPDVVILASLHRNGIEEPVAIQQGSLLGISFHPELTDSSAWHIYFLNLVLDQKEKKRLNK
jgi:5'-phosphate synthase pdxT subunit